MPITSSSQQQHENTDRLVTSFHTKTSLQEDSHGHQPATHPAALSLDNLMDDAPASSTVPSLVYSSHEQDTFTQVIEQVAAITPEQLVSLLALNPPLLIDMRSQPEYDTQRLQGSVHLNIPSLLLKRYRRGTIANFNLESFITTTEGTDVYMHWLASHDPKTVVVYDNHMDETDLATSAWTLVGALTTLFGSDDRHSPAHGPSSFASHAAPSPVTPLTSPLSRMALAATKATVYWLKGGFHTFEAWPPVAPYLVQGVTSPTNPSSTSSTAANTFLSAEPPLPRIVPHLSRSATTFSRSLQSSDLVGTNVQRRASLFTLDTSNVRHKSSRSWSSLHPAPQPPSTLSSSSSRQPQPPPPLPSKPTPSSSRHLHPPLSTLSSSTSNHPPSALKNNGSPSSDPPPLPPHTFQAHAPDHASAQQTSPPSSSASSAMATMPHSARSTASSSPSSALPPMPPPSASILPANEMLDDDEPEPEPTPLTEQEYAFIVSAIVPDFLYLGPEIATAEQMDGLKERSIRRILNMAEECDDDVPGLKQTFKYAKLAARDTVEMQNVETTLRKAVNIIEDAKLHHEPIYVHCKAGKSRSVAVILAYFVLSEKWSLRRAYRHVIKARPWVSPNIGFVAELMKLEASVIGRASNFVDTDWHKVDVRSPPSPASLRDIGIVRHAWQKTPAPTPRHSVPSPSSNINTSDLAATPTNKSAASKQRPSSATGISTTPPSVQQDSPLPPVTSSPSLPGTKCHQRYTTS
ncbi:hypothetical protein DM01DRAFT_1314079 [Hesseltinella vesiculosa]|uniref:protein-tyrosine-phosphatase n=1 Tax=Hesseltinella vesiculosa TaxID=101127 RepID=A0A1X2GWX4_9FUNG|nr:hypothetical protein DM01DRAFT_1314079 [Hesseltinella vesiculosa]